PVIAVVEEAQSVLGSGGSSGEGPYVSWVKEGRKYDLGAVLITQQPGSISGEILSQGDNWFCFHLLSADDLRAIKSANAHFSDDILSSLLNEPIPGHGVFWSSVGGKSYPIPIRVLSFEEQYQAQDPQYNRPAVKTAAESLRQRFASALASARSAVQLDVLSSGEAASPVSSTPPEDGEGEVEEEADVLGSYEEAAINALRSDTQFLDKLRQNGMPWRGVLERLKQELPDILSDRDKIAYGLVARAMNTVIGPQNTAWRTDKRPSKTGSGYTTWIVVT
ncbi:MAG TPA: hypothetical protein VIL32_17085, partial [Steroidobacteraceae bacterium]